ncbi:MAG: hypothetical protein WC511_05130 [Candidatus Pacearchaeota archaeon]
MTGKPEFGMTRKENFYDEYIGKFVVIYPASGNNNFVGKLNSVRDGYAILNPFSGSEYKDGKLVRKLIYENSKVLISPCTAIEPTNEVNIAGFFKNINEQNQSEKNK